MFYITLPIDIEAFTRFCSKCFFNFIACAEVKEVVDKEAEEEWRFAFDDDAREDAWCVGACFEAEGFECGSACVIPVSCGEGHTRSFLGEGMSCLE